MKTVVTKLCGVLLLAVCALAQDPPTQNPPTQNPPTQNSPGQNPPTQNPGTVETARKQPPVKMSVEGREALARCRDLAKGARGLRGAERTRTLAEAASNYDRVAGGFESEAVVAAKAAYEAAELWRRHGSVPLAEKDYLLAASTDPGRYGPRGLLGAADMQRRQKRYPDALATYRKVITTTPAVPQAQAARLAMAKLLQAMDRIDDAVAAAQLALECARPGRQTIEVCNDLALILIRKGDLDAASRAIEHAARSIEGIDNGDPIVRERLEAAIESMSARRALLRERDRLNGTAADAILLDRDRRRSVAPGPKKL